MTDERIDPKRRDGEDEQEFILWADNTWTSAGREEDDELQNESLRVVPKATRDARDVEIRRLKAKIGEADYLLGRAGAGGSAAGTVPAIHNLIHRAEQAEAQVKELREALATARRCIRRVYGAGFDSRCREVATDGICEIDAALASSEPKENERAPYDDALREAAAILRLVTFKVDPREREQPVPDEVRIAADSWLAQWETT